MLNYVMDGQSSMVLVHYLSELGYNDLTGVSNEQKIAFFKYFLNNQIFFESF